MFQAIEGKLSRHLLVLVLLGVMTWVGVVAAQTGPIISATKEAFAPDPAGSGDTITYVVIITNSGDADALVNYVDEIPPLVGDLDIIRTGGGADMSLTADGTGANGNGRVDIRDIPVAAGEDVEVRYSVVVDTPLPLNASRVVDQGLVSGVGFAAVLTDDPAVVDAFGDPTPGLDPTVVELEAEPFATLSITNLPDLDQVDVALTIVPLELENGAEVSLSATFDGATDTLTVNGSLTDLPVGGGTLDSTITTTNTIINATFDLEGFQLGGPTTLDASLTIDTADAMPVSADVAVNDIVLGPMIRLTIEVTEIFQDTINADVTLTFLDAFAGFDVSVRGRSLLQPPQLLDILLSNGFIDGIFTNIDIEDIFNASAEGTNVDLRFGRRNDRGVIVDAVPLGPFQALVSIDNLIALKSPSVIAADVDLTIGSVANDTMGIEGGIPLGDSAQGILTANDLLGLGGDGPDLRLVVGNINGETGDIMNGFDLGGPRATLDVSANDLFTAPNLNIIAKVGSLDPDTGDILNGFPIAGGQARVELEVGVGAAGLQGPSLDIFIGNLDDDMHIRDGILFATANPERPASLLVEVKDLDPTLSPEINLDLGTIDDAGEIVGGVDTGTFLIQAGVDDLLGTLETNIHIGSLDAATREIVGGVPILEGQATVEILFSLADLIPEVNLNIGSINPRTRRIQQGIAFLDGRAQFQVNNALGFLKGATPEVNFQAGTFVPDPDPTDDIDVPPRIVDGVTFFGMPVVMTGTDVIDFANINTEAVLRVQFGGFDPATGLLTGGFFLGDEPSDGIVLFDLRDLLQILPIIDIRLGAIDEQGRPGAGAIPFAGGLVTASAIDILNDARRVSAELEEIPLDSAFLNLEVLILPRIDLSVSVTEIDVLGGEGEVEAENIFSAFALNAAVRKIPLAGGQLDGELNDLLGTGGTGPELVLTLTRVPLTPDDGELRVALTVPFNNLGMTDLSASIVDFPLGNNLFLDVTLDDIVGTFTASVTFELFAPPIVL